MLRVWSPAVDNFSEQFTKNNFSDEFSEFIRQTVTAFSVWSLTSVARDVLEF